MTGYNQDEIDLAYMLSGEIYQRICDNDDGWLEKAHELSALIQQVQRRHEHENFKADPRQTHATDDRQAKPL